MVFEQSLQNALFSSQGEKSFIDKLLSKENSNRVRELTKQKKLSREDLLELLYLCVGTESKLVNYGTWDRYIVLKFFVWIREFIKVAENLYDYQDDLYEQEATCNRCHKLYKDFLDKKKECNCIKEGKVSLIIPRRPLTPRTKKFIFNCERNIEHASKFLIDLYLNITGTTLSLHGTGFLELLKNKFEISYPQGNSLNTPLDPGRKPGLLGLGRK